MKGTSVLLLISVLGCVISQNAPIPLTNGVAYSSRVNSGQTILFTYDLTKKPCTELTVRFLSGDADLWVSRWDKYPTIFSYSTYSYPCNAEDIVYIKPTDADFAPTIYYISAYLDNLVYDTYTNMTIIAIESPVSNIVSNQTATISGSFGSQQTMCVPDADIGFSLSVSSSSATNLGLTLTRLDAQGPYDEVQEIQISNSSNTFNYSTAIDPNFQAGFYYFTLSSDESTSSYQATITQGPVGLPIPPQSNHPSIPITSGSPSSGNFNNMTYFLLTVGPCDDVVISVSASSLASYHIWASFDIFGTPSSLGWQSEVGSSSLAISHHASGFGYQTQLNIAVVCTSNCAGTYTINATTSLGSDAISKNAAIPFSGFVHADQMQWHTICIPDISLTLNITARAINPTVGEDVDVVLSRYPTAITNFTAYTYSGVPNWNAWLDWPYSSKPFPGCPRSFFMNATDPSRAFTTGTYYVGFYSFCLESCAYCLHDMNWTAQATVAGDTSGCIYSNVTMSVPITHSTTGPPQPDSAATVFESFAIASIMLAMSF